MKGFIAGAPFSSESGEASLAMLVNFVNKKGRKGKDERQVLNEPKTYVTLIFSNPIFNDGS